MQSLSELNENFAKESIEFSTGQGDLPKCNIKHERGAGEIYLNGGHVTSFQPAGESPVLWMSNKSNFENGKPIRGGIPICWPWFGAAINPELPQHGFARNSNWKVIETGETVDAATIRLRLTDDQKTAAIWNYRFELLLQIRIGEKLELELQTTNRGDDALTIGTAIHTYFQVSDIANIELAGLEQTNYADQLDRNKEKIQQGQIAVSQEVDRVYLDSNDEVSILDSGAKRKIIVAKTGSLSTVVWNPWIAKSQRMSDFPDDGYQTMICVETANAMSDVRQLAAGSSHMISQQIEVKPI